MNKKSKKKKEIKKEKKEIVEIEINNEIKKRKKPNLNRMFKCLNIISTILLIISTGVVLYSLVGFAGIYHDAQDLIYREEIRDIELQPGEYWLFIETIDEEFYIDFTIAKKTCNEILYIYLATYDNISFYGSSVLIYSYAEIDLLYHGGIMQRSFKPTHNDTWVFLVKNLETNNRTIYCDISFELSTSYITRISRRFEVLKATRDYIVAPVIGFLSLIYTYEKIQKVLKYFRKKRNKKYESMQEEYNKAETKKEKMKEQENEKNAIKNKQKK